MISCTSRTEALARGGGLFGSYASVDEREGRVTPISP